MKLCVLFDTSFQENLRILFVMYIFVEWVFLLKVSAKVLQKYSCDSRRYITIKGKLNLQTFKPMQLV